MTDYTSPKSWGPHFWYMMRCLAHNYPIKPTSEDAKHVKIFYEELQFILPCDLCKYTYKQHFTKFSIDNYLSTRDDLITWVETIFQETKKVIGDKRIKIMDNQAEETSEVVPVRVGYNKSKVDPIEEQLNMMRREVMKKEAVTKAIPVPTLAQVKAVPIQNVVKTLPVQNKQIKIPIVDKIPKPKIEPVKVIKNTVDQTRTEPIILKKQVELSVDKINAGARLTHKLIRDNIRPNIITTFIEPNKTNILQPIVQAKSIFGIDSIKPTPSIKPVMNKVNNVRTMNANLPVQSLVLTRKCKKCEH